MTSRAAEIAHGLRTASMAVRFQKDALPEFHDSNRAVGISFWALPMFAILQVLTSIFANELLTAALTIEGVTEAVKEKPAGEFTPVIAMLSLLVRWLAPLLIAYEFARGMAVSSAWPRFVTAANWCAVLQILPLTVGAIVLQAVGAPPATMQVVMFMTMLWVIAVDWFIAKWALGINGGQAALLVGIVLAADALLATFTKMMIT